MSFKFDGAFADSADAKILQNSFNDIMHRIQISEADKPIVKRDCFAIIEQLSKMN